MRRPMLLLLCLLSACSSRSAASEYGWLDSKTGLLWYSKANSFDLDFSHAISYCEALGIPGWRIPEIDELTGAWRDGLASNVGGLVGNTFLWSAKVDGPRYTAGTTFAEVFFPYNDGGIGNMSLSLSKSGRVLCVHQDNDMHGKG